MYYTVHTTHGVIQVWYTRYCNVVIIYTTSWIYAAILSWTCIKFLLNQYETIHVKWNYLFWLWNVFELELILHSLNWISQIRKDVEIKPINTTVIIKPVCLLYWETNLVMMHSGLRYSFMAFKRYKKFSDWYSNSSLYLYVTQTCIVLLYKVEEWRSQQIRVYLSYYCG